MKRHDKLGMVTAMLFVVLMIVGQMTAQEIGLDQQAKQSAKTVSFSPDTAAFVAGDTNNMSWIEPGTFVMGSPITESGHSPHEDQHTVTITSGFYMGKYEVTQGEYLEVVGNNPSFFSSTNGYNEYLNRPVEQITWYEATNYCRLLTERESLAGHISTDWAYRLPTEAEWEYACRAGTTTAFYFGDSVDGGMANFFSHFIYNTSDGDIIVFNPAVLPLEQTTTVGMYGPNPWGLFDMSGNVVEWCQDYWFSNTSHTQPQIDPQGPVFGDYNIARGGSWRSKGSGIRSASHNINYPSDGNFAYGFRIVLAPVAPVYNIFTKNISRQTIGNIITPSGAENSLVFITHGRIPPGDNVVISTAWVDSMSNSISAYLISHGVTNWNVQGYKWIEDANKLLPQTALQNARQQGIEVGRQILSKGYTHVYFIAHSAGSGLIQSATDIIKSNNSSVLVHETFLDPFVGADFSGTSTYGYGADWADNYSAKDKDTLNNYVPFTYNILSHAYNVDVTSLDFSNRVQLAYYVSGNGTPCYVTESVHDWPISFYSNTIVNASVSGYEGFGFQLSQLGSNWNYALSNYVPGNAAPGRILGTPDPTECRLSFPIPTYPSIIMDILSSPAVQSVSGTITKNPNGSLQLVTGSSVWVGFFPTLSNIVNTLSFEADFTSMNGAQGLLTIYWDDMIVGSVDERLVQDGFQRYTFKFPNASSNSVHMLGFRADPFTNIQSCVVLTNITTTFSGISQKPSLAIVGSTNGLPIYQMLGQSGFEYHIQASANLLNWKSIAVLANTNGAVRFLDQESTNYHQRFYRVIESD